MSFRVKSTHQLLQPQALPNENESVSYLFSSDEKKNDDHSSFLSDSYLQQSEVQRQVQNRPKVSNQKGMAIRTVPSAQADHM